MHRSLVFDFASADGRNLKQWVCYSFRTKRQNLTYDNIKIYIQIKPQNGLHETRNIPVYTRQIPSVLLRILLIVLPSVKSTLQLVRSWLQIYFIIIHSSFFKKTNCSFAFKTWKHKHEMSWNFYIFKKKGETNQPGGILINKCKDVRPAHTITENCISPPFTPPSPPFTTNERVLAQGLDATLANIKDYIVSTGVKYKHEMHQFNPHYIQTHA